MPFSEHALKILNSNYYARDSEGDLKETKPADLMRRLANSIFPSEPELSYNLYESLMSQKVIFNSPVMFNIGLPTKQILAACWVGDLTDDMDSILEAIKVTGQVFKHGSGMGLPLTNLRPKKDIVSNSGYASGPLSFMELFDKTGEVIKSGGKRRAAFMSMNRVDHPDIKAIIEAKYEATGALGEQSLENMNISIAATDTFMQAVKDKEKFELRFNDHLYETIDANKLFDLIAKCAWRSGDPGIFFIDSANKFNTLPSFSDLQATNPCVAGDTIIQTIEGPIPIKELAGTQPFVYCVDKGDLPTLARVDWIKLTRTNSKTLIISIDTKESITVTPDHKIMIIGKGWVPAKELQIDDTVRHWNLLANSKITAIEEGPCIDVYDMAVPEHNNFIANNIVVHNCGEQILHPYTCCNLGHINLTALTKKTSVGWEFDYEEFHELTRVMTVALDRIVDIMDFPSSNFEKNTLEVRPIGLGYTGLAEVLYRLRIPYSNSQKFVRDITHLMISTSIETSIELAELYGTTKTIKQELPHIASLILQYTGDYDLYERCLISGIRNSSWTTLAPTGTTSLALDAKSYGIEPHFGLAYRKNFVSQDSNIITHRESYFNETFAEAIKDLTIDKDKLHKDILRDHGSCQNIDYIPDSIKRVFEVAHDLNPKQHLQIMAAAQPYISSAISKTINLPRDATIDDVKEVYLTAWELGLKGATVYRDGCKDFQPISFSEDKGIDQFAKLPRGTSIVRGDEADGGSIDAWRTACTKMYIIPGYSTDYEDVLIETFLAKRSGGGCDSNLKAIALLVSLALRKGVPVKDIEDELFSITCTHCVSAKAAGKDINALSCPQAIARTLRKQKGRASNYNYLNEQPIVDTQPVKVYNEIKLSTPINESVCNKCGEPTIMASGCITCPNCGHGGCDAGRE